MEEDKEILKIYCKAMQDIGEMLVYVSEKWVTQNKEENK
jgi:hypothetical protein